MALTVVQPAKPGAGNVIKQANEVINENHNYNILTGAIINRDGNGAKSLISSDIDSEHFAASVNKVPVSVLVLNKLRAGEITLDTVTTWTAADRRGGAGVFDAPDSPTSATVRELLSDLLNRSGNTAVRAAVNGLLGGAPQVNEAWKSQYGSQHTYLMPLDGPGKRFYLGNTSAREAAKMFATLVQGDDQYAQLVRGYMETNIWDEMGVRAVKSNTTAIRLVNKIGYLDDPDGNNRHDVGMIINSQTGEKYSYAFLQTAPNEVADATAQANSALKQLGVITLSAAGDKTAGSSSNATNRGQAKKLQPVPAQGRMLY
jgi:beta-lactamase class A